VTPPSVLLDASFLDALVIERRPEARSVYAQLVDDYERNTIRLRALSTDLAIHRPDGSDLLAPVETIHVGGQHRRAADSAHAAIPESLRLAAVLVHRERLARVVSCEPWWHTVDGVDALVIGRSGDEPDPADSPAGYLPF
jgi:hypothetical protein